MTDSAKSSSDFSQPRAAVLVGMALLSGYAAVTGGAIYAKSHRTESEKAESPTAVGDTSFFQAPKSFDASVPLANFDGHSLYFVDWTNLSDSVMIRAGMDDTNSCQVYKNGEAKNGEANTFYLKLKQGFYVKTKRQ